MSAPSPVRRHIVTLLAVLPWILVLFQFLLVIPRYNKIFRDFALKLPLFIEAIFAVAAWLESHKLLAFLFTFVLTACSVGAAHAVQVIPVSKKLRLIVLALVFGLPCLLFLVSWVGMTWTERRLAEGFDR